MSEKLNLITGATGLLGSHIAEQLMQRGERVRALVRPTSDTTFLKEMGVELVTGDLGELASLRQAVAGADIVYHSAAKVGDWGPWQQFQEHIIDATRNLLEACREEKAGRFLYVSSVQVYGHPKTNGGQIHEDEPLGQHLRSWELYARSKIEAEQLCRNYPGDVTILRPSWIYGPRDRNSLPRIVNNIRAKRMGTLGDGSHLLNLVYAGDVAECAITAANAPNAAGQAYNVASPGEISQKEWLNLITETLNLPPIQRSLPPRLAYAVGFCSEMLGKLRNLQRSPHITRYGVCLMTRPTHFSNDKAFKDLGWQMRTPIRKGMQRTLEWYRNAMAQPEVSGS